MKNSSTLIYYAVLIYFLTTNLAHANSENLYFAPITCEYYERLCKTPEDKAKAQQLRRERQAREAANNNETKRKQDAENQERHKNDSDIAAEVKKLGNHRTQEAENFIEMKKKAEQARGRSNFPISNQKNKQEYETYLQIVILNKKTHGICSNAILHRFKQVDLDNPANAYKEMNNEIVKNYPAGNNKEYTLATIMQIKKGEHVVIAKGHKEYQSFQCASTILAVFKANSHAEALVTAKASFVKNTITWGGLESTWPDPMVSGE